VWRCFWDWLAALPPSSASFAGTLTGSFLGLIALLLGALFNAHLNRKRDDDLRGVDRIALAKSIYAELTAVHRTLLENAQRLTEHAPGADEGFMLPDLHHSVQVFSHMLPKIGLLPVDIIRKVMDAYVLIQQYAEGMIFLGGTMQPNMPENRRVVYMDAVHAKSVAAINLARADFIKGATEALEPHLKTRRSRDGS
jgi:hypothetical protein